MFFILKIRVSIVCGNVELYENHDTLVPTYVLNPNFNGGISIVQGYFCNGRLIFN
jgi:hypothetical protein